MPDKDILLLDPATGKPVCRKEVSTLVDQSSIIGNSDAATPFRVNFPVVAGALAGSGVAANAGKLDAALVHAPGSSSSGAGTTSSPLNVPAAPVVPVATDSVQGKVELTGSAQMPAEKTRDDSALTPAGAAKLLRYIKPVASTGALTAEQLSADGIEVPMFSNFSCTGGTNGAPKWTMPVAGGGNCAIDLGAYGGGGGGGGGGGYTPGQVVFSGMTDSCTVVLAQGGLYSIEYMADNGTGFQSGPYRLTISMSGRPGDPCAGPNMTVVGGNTVGAAPYRDGMQFATYLTSVVYMWGG